MNVSIRNVGNGSIYLSTTADGILVKTTTPDTTWIHDALRCRVYNNTWHSEMVTAFQSEQIRPGMYRIVLSDRQDLVFDIYDPMHPTLMLHKRTASPNQLWSIETNATRVLPVYHAGYAFEQWTCQRETDQYEALASRCLVFYTSGSRAVIKRIVHEREPVNIGMRRYYDQDAMERLFGWRISAYQRLYDKERLLAPNIAIYTPTYVNDHRAILIHVLNVVGYALDHPLQPDFLYFTATGSLYEAYEGLFTRIFVAAQHLKMTSIVMSLVGAGNFATLFPLGGPNGFQRSVWLPAFRCVRDRFAREYTPAQIDFMGLAGSSIEHELLGDGHVDIGHFPSNIKHVASLQTTLFINAWDPHSIPGNGNKQDNSLDGHMGRTTMIGVLGWGSTNHYLLDSSRYVHIDVGHGRDGIVPRQ